MALGGWSFPTAVFFLQSRRDSVETVQQRRDSSSDHSATRVLVAMAITVVLSPSGRRDGRLGHSKLLSQVIEASDVVHTALTHHASELRVHFCHIRKATGLKGIV